MVEKAMCRKKDVLEYVFQRYETRPDYPWGTPPENMVFRHKENRKWFGVILEVKKKSLGLSGIGYMNILNVKCDPEMAFFLVSIPGIRPGYHMNKKNWISIFLDGTVAQDQVFSLIDQSFLLTEEKRKKKEGEGCQ